MTKLFFTLALTLLFIVTNNISFAQSKNDSTKKSSSSSSSSKIKEKNKDKNFHLIVPDGSWTQAVKFYRREPGLSEIQCVSIPKGAPGRYKLRKTHDENRLSTYEAITRAISILEENPLMQETMEEIFDAMVTNVLKARTAFEN